MNLKKFFSKSWPIWLILALVFIFFWKFFLRGLLPIPADITVGMYYPWLDYKWGYIVGVPVKNGLLSDVVSQWYPFRIYAAKLIRTGHLPLWNPLSFAGAPLLADFQSSILYPLNILYLFLKTPIAWSLGVVFQPLLAVIFTYLFLRKLGLRKLSSLIGGIVYAFSGFSIIWFEYNIHSHVAAFIPLLLYALKRFFEDRRWGLVFSAGLAMQIFAGYPQVTFYSLCLSIAFFIFCLCKEKKIYKNLFSLFLSFLFFLILGLGLAAPQLFSGFELFWQSQRLLETTSGQLIYLPWHRLITFLAPDFFGNPTTLNSWGVGDYTAIAGYSGILTLILATLAVLKVKKKEVLFFLGLFIISLLLTLESPVAVLVHQFGVLGSKATSTTRILVLANLSLATLAAFSLDLLVSKRRPFKNVFKIGALFLLIVLGIFTGVFISRLIISQALPEFVEGPGLDFINRWLINLRVGLRNLILPLGLTVLATVILCLFRIKLLRRFLAFVYIFFLIFELFRFGWKYLPFISQDLIFPTTPVIDFLKEQKPPFRILGGDAMPMNMWAAYDLESLAGYDTVYPLRYAKFLAVVNGGKVNKPLDRYGDIQSYESPLLNLGNVKYILAVKRNEQDIVDQNGRVSYKLRFPKFKPVFDDKSVRVLENKEVLPRAFIIYKYRVITDEAEIIDNLLSPDFNLAQEVILEKELPHELIAGETEEINYQRDGNDSTITVKHSGDGLLFVSDSFYPGWKAFVDGKESEIYRADFAFRAVFVPKGSYVVSFIYDPQSFKIGAAISLVTLIFLGGVFIYETKNLSKFQQKSVEPVKR